MRSFKTFVLLLSISSCAPLPAAAQAQANRQPQPKALLHPAASQSSAPPALCDPLHLIPGCTPLTNEDLLARLDKLALPDFEYAYALSVATNNVVSTPCWKAWVDVISARQKQLIGADNQPLTEPDPHLATSVEKISELLAELRPDSNLSTSCAALAAAGGKDAATLIQGILSGGALGLFKLPIPVAPIP